MQAVLKNWQVCEATKRPTTTLKEKDWRDCVGQQAGQQLAGRVADRKLLFKKLIKPHPLPVPE